MTTRTMQSRSRARRLLLVGLALIACIAVAAAIYFRPIERAPAPALATLNADVTQGEYLATIGNCAACHTTPDGDRYGGGVAFRTDFGTIYSTNITPDPERGIGGWSFADFHTAMKHGLRPGGQQLYPAFPYSYFAKLSDDDIASLHAYLQTVPASTQTNRANRMGFPYSDRRLMHFWNRMFHSDAPFAADSTRTAEQNRGAYLVEALAHCGACHTPRNALGGERSGAALTGGSHYDRVLTGEYKLWSAPNLTTADEGLGAWSKAQIAQYLLEGHNERSVVHGPMNEVVMASTRLLRPADAQAMAAYLATLSPAGERFDWPFTGSNYDEGEIVYTVHCGTCHLPDGKGDLTLGVPLAKSPLVQAEDPASLINVILYGPQLPPPPFAVNRSRMRPFGKRLSDEDVAAVATYVRQSFGNNADSVSAEDVAKQR